MKIIIWNFGTTRRFIMDNVIKQLTDMKIGKVLEQEPLANHTTMKIGGPADLFIVPSSIENIEKRCRSSKKMGCRGG